MGGKNRQIKKRGGWSTASYQTIQAKRNHGQVEEESRPVSSHQQQEGDKEVRAIVRNDKLADLLLRKKKNMIMN